MKTVAFLCALPLLLAGCMTTQRTEPAPASVAVVFDGGTATPVIVEGLANRDTGRAVEANDPVRVASISKLVMALATLRLVDQDVVDLDTDVSEYLGWVRHPAFPDAKVTLAQLLMHRSALCDDAGYVIPLGESLQDKLAQPEAWYADAPPGEAPFEYANLGSPLVATVLEAASAERYDRLLEREVFAPLGVTACLNWIGCDEEMVARAVTLYRSTGAIARDDPSDVPPNCTIPVAEGRDCDLSDYVPGSNASIFSPQGGVRIGMLDLAKIGQAILDKDGAFLSPESHRLLRQNVTPIEGNSPNFCFYGLAVHRLHPGMDGCNDTLFPDAVKRIGHAGEAYGLRSGLWIDSEGGTGLAYFTTAVPDRTSPDEGGFAAEEIALVRRAMERETQSGGE